MGNSIFEKQNFQQLQKYSVTTLMEHNLFHSLKIIEIILNGKLASIWEQLVKTYILRIAKNIKKIDSRSLSLTTLA